MFKSHNMGLIPYHVDPEYSVGEIKVFSTTPTIFQNVNNPSIMLPVVNVLDQQLV